MPAESAILAHAPDLAPTLMFHLLKGESASSGLDQVAEADRPFLYKSFRLAEAAALASLCEEALWNDYGLLPALRDDFLGDELAELGSKVLRADGRAIRDIRERALREAARLRQAGAHPDELSGSPSAVADFERAAPSRYVEALSQWIAPTPLPEPFKKRVLETWHPRFGAAFRHELKSHDRLGSAFRSTAASSEDRRFDELNRQSWRLDEVLEKLDKWARANPNAVRGAARASRGDSGVGRARRFLTVGAVALVAAALLGAALWIAFGASPGVESFVAQVQARRLEGVSERVARAAAWMGSEPIPRDVFTTAIFALQNAEDAGKPITPEQVNAALVDLQQKRLCHAAADGWVFHEQVREKYRVANASGSEWWERAFQMLLASVPPPADDESLESVKRWRLLLPHLITLFESAPDEILAGPQMPTLLSTLSRGLLAIRIEPGRRPELFDLPEPDALQKRINGFLGTPGKYFETEFKNIEQKYGRFSNAMIAAHRFVAELSWRNRKLKEEQDSWIRAARALEKQEPRDFGEIAFCYLRLGISRAIAGDQDGAEEAFAEALKIAGYHGDARPGIGRMERKIARVYADLGIFDLGWKHHEQALEALIKAYPARGAEVAELHEEQAELLIDYRQYAKGIALLHRGIEVWRTNEYPTSPHIARALGRLANAQMLAGEMADAEQNVLSQREMLQREYGLSSIQARDAEVDLAMILLNANDPAKAAEAASFLKPRLAIQLDAKFADDAETAITRSLYARALAQTGQTAEAIAQFDRASAALLNSQSRPTFLVAGFLRDYGQALLRTDRKFEGLKALENAEAEFSALTRMRPRYLRIATAQIDEIRKLAGEARK